MPRIASYANVASTLALVLALSGTAYAAATITGKDVKNGSLTGKDVKDGSVTGKDLRDRSVRAADLTTGALPGATAQLTGGGTIPSGPNNEFSFDTQGLDTGNMYAAPNGFVTVRVPGTYLVTGAISFGGVGGAQAQTRIVVNGGIEAIATVDDAPSELTLPVSTTLALVAGDRVTLGTFSSVAATVVDFNGSTPDAWLAVQMVSP